MTQQVLVTGGSGFVAVHAISQLLAQGYRVRTTVRDLAKRPQVLAALAHGGITSTEALSFIEADLLADHNWHEAAAGCDYVLHIASPIFLRLPKHEDEMIKPAVQGTLRVLKAARDAGVKRVVMTSNFGAVGYSHKDRTRLIDEHDWTDINEPGLSAYNKSKVRAERAAWDFMAKEGGALELVVVNPMGIFGPTLSPVLSSGLELLRNILSGKMKKLPNLTLGIVDVRDVADLHIRAMVAPDAAGQRFLALAGGTLSLAQIAALLRQHFPEAAAKAPTQTLPDWQVRVAALFSDKAKAIKPLLGVYRQASNEKARQMLGWAPRSNQEAILASVESMLTFKSLEP